MYSSKSNRLDIANGALSKLGISPIGALFPVNAQTSNIDTVMLKLNNVLDNSIYEVLEKHTWEFAIKSTNLVHIARKDNKTPSKYEAYKIPNDYIRFVGVGKNIGGCCCFTNLPDITQRLLEKRLGVYTQSIVFRIVDNNLYILDANQEQFCCEDHGYDTLYYISNKLENMRMTHSFKELCSLIVYKKLLPSYSDVDLTNKINAIQKTFDQELYKAITNDFQEFQYRITTPLKNNDEDCFSRGHFYKNKPNYLL